MRKMMNDDPLEDVGNPSEIRHQFAQLFDYDDLYDLIADNPILERLVALSDRPEQEPPSPFWSISASVGFHTSRNKAGANRKADVKKVMDRLYQLELLNTKDYYYENLYLEEEKNTVSIQKIPATLAAIKVFQKMCFNRFDGLIDLEGNRATFEKLRRTESLDQLRELHKKSSCFHSYSNRQHS